MTDKPETVSILRHLHSKPGHDEVKADFRQLLVVEFGVALTDVDFERRVPEVKGRIDALIGRTVFEAKSDLDKEWGDVERRMPDYLADREREERQHFVGIASDGCKWAVFELAGGKLVKVKETVLNPEEAGADAKANGVKFGRKPKLTPHRKREAIKRRDKDGETLRSIGRSYNVSAATISRLAP
jgi:hypothetical protein